MAKKLIAAALIPAIILAFFAACKKTFKYGLVITDNEGKTRVVATDDSGKAVMDEAGNLIVIETEKNGKPATDKDGKQETNKVAHPDYYVNDEVIEGSKFVVPIPEGWEQSGKTVIRLTHKATGAEIDFMVKEGKSRTTVEAETEMLINTILENDDKATVSTANAKIAGAEALKYTLFSPKAGDGAGGDIVIYVFEKNSVVYLFQGVVKAQYRKQIDFEAVMNTVKFR